MTEVSGGNEVDPDSRGGEPEPPISWRRRKGFVAGAFVLVIGAVAALVFVIRQDGGQSLTEVAAEARASAMTTQLPPLPEDAAPTAAFLADAAAGGKLVEYHRASGPLAQPGNDPRAVVAACGAAARALDQATLLPAELIGLATASPDAFLSEVLVDDIVVTRDLIATCRSGEAVLRERLAEVASMHTIVARRLQGYGVE